MAIFTDDGKEYESEAHLVLGEHVKDEVPISKSEPGNIDPYTRPMVNNSDGSVSTVRSMSFNRDGQEILIPTVAHDGSGILSDDAAIAQYDRSGLHLGKFATPEEATAFAEQYHKDQEKIYGGDPFDRAASRLKASTTPSGGRTEGLATKVPEAIAQGVIGTVGKIATLPGRVASGQVDMSSKEGVDEAVDAAFQLTTGGMGTALMRTPGIGIFGGLASGNLNVKTAMKAAKMFDEGATEGEIISQTGFFKGHEGQMKYEIPDNKSQLNTPAIRSLINKKVDKLFLYEAYDHPELYKAYPSLQSIKIKTLPSDSKDLGYFDSTSNTIALRENMPAEQMRSTILHEIQHAVQKIEGFANGASYSTPFQTGWEPTIKLLDAIKRNPSKFTKEQVAWEQEVRQHQKGIIELQEKLQEHGLELAKKNYTRTAGEVEARNVSYRADMSSFTRALEQAAGKTPKRTEDIKSDLIVSRNPQHYQPFGEDGLGNDIDQGLKRGDIIFK